MGEWRDGAACAAHEVDPELWFSNSVLEQARAIQVCLSCPVLYACRASADGWEGTRSEGVLWGIISGETPKARYNRRASARQRARREKELQAAYHAAGLVGAGS